MDTLMRANEERTHVFLSHISIRPLGVGYFSYHPFCLLFFEFSFFFNGSCRWLHSFVCFFSHLIFPSPAWSHETWLSYHPRVCSMWNGLNLVATRTPASSFHLWNFISFHLIWMSTHPREKEPSSEVSPLFPVWGVLVFQVQFRTKGVNCL